VDALAKQVLDVKVVEGSDALFSLGELLIPADKLHPVGFAKVFEMGCQQVQQMKVAFQNKVAPGFSKISKNLKGKLSWDTACKRSFSKLRRSDRAPSLEVSLFFEVNNQKVELS
jgi:hypothetical protein